MKKEKFSLSLFIATWFKTGLIPPIIGTGMAGTYGSFFALPLCFLGVFLAKESGEGLIYLFLCLFIGLLGIITVPIAEKVLGPKKWKGKIREKDQNQIVIDEVYGMLIACIPILFVQNYSWYHFLVAFILFRIFDIVKVQPAKYFDRMKNEFGVMMDDGIAGMYAAIVLQILIWWVF